MCKKAYAHAVYNKRAVQAYMPDHYSEEISYVLIQKLKGAICVCMRCQGGDKASACGVQNETGLGITIL